MRKHLILVLATLLLIAGCGGSDVEKQITDPVSTSPPVEEAVPEPVEEPVVETVEEEKPSDDINIDTSTLSEEDIATLQRYKEACDKGNAGLCAALKRIEERLGVSAEDLS